MGSNPGSWKTIYTYLSQIPDNQFIGWDHLGEVIGQDTIKKSRGALTRARIELEVMDGRTITGQNAAGFVIVRQENA